MMIKNTTSIGAVDPAASKMQKEEATAKVPSDRVNTAEAQKAMAMARSVQSKVGVSRSAMLAQVENAIRAGTYRPSAGQLADRLVSAAEIDARLQAMMGA
jgi:anti-sigma28 factor (negative regulator of flagellin synthesis)